MNTHIRLTYEVCFIQYLFLAFIQTCIETVLVTNNIAYIETVLVTNNIAYIETVLVTIFMSTIYDYKVGLFLFSLFYKLEQHCLNL